MPGLHETSHPADGSPLFSLGPIGPSDGTTVLFLHGLANSGRIFGPLMNALGESAMALPMWAPTMSAALFDGEASTANLRAWLEEISPPPWHVVAHSMGGVIAGLLAREFPGDVLSLTLINSPLPDTTDRLQGRLGYDRRGWDLRRMLAGAFVGRIAGSAQARPRGKPQVAVARSALRGFIAHPSRVDAAVLVDSLLNSRVSSGWAFSRLAQRLPASAMSPVTGLSTLVILGAKDPLIDECDHTRINAAYPGCTLEVLPEVAHFAHLEAIDRVGELTARHIRSAASDLR